MNLQSAAIAVSVNPLKYRFESEIRAKYFIIRWPIHPALYKITQKKGPNDKRASR